MWPIFTCLLEKFDQIENGIEELKMDKTFKRRYLQAIKLLSITQERRDRELIKEIRYRLNEKKKKYRPDT